MPGEDTPPPNGANTKRKRASNSKVLKAIIDIMSRTAAPLTLRPNQSQPSGWPMQRRIS
jgi:hypothetical protein